MTSIQNRLLKFTSPILVRIMHILTWVQSKLLPLLPEHRQESIIVSQIEKLPVIAGAHMWHTDVYKKAFRLSQQYGVHITPNHFYSPIPDTQSLETSDLWDKESELIGLDLNLDIQLDLLRIRFPMFQAEYNSIPMKGATGLPPYAFHFYNGIFDGMDALILYCMVRHYKPNFMIEIGSGWSTRLSAQAAILNGNTKLVCIEPYPDSVLKSGFPGLVELRAQKVEECDLSFFQQLGNGDILFVDTSHVVRTSGDVNYIYLEILPRLREGVIIHIHDIFFPLEYPKWWITEQLLFWNEQYLLQAFLAFNSHFKILLTNNYLRLKYLDYVKKTFPNCPFYDTGQSVWIQKTR